MVGFESLCHFDERSKEKSYVQISQSLHSFEMTKREKWVKNGNKGFREGTRISNYNLLSP